MANTVKLNGYVTVPKDRWEAVLAALPTHIELTRAEEGCLSFEVIPDPNIFGRLNVDEEFSTPEAFHAHQTRASASDWAAITAGLERSYTVSGLE